MFRRNVALTSAPAVCALLYIGVGLVAGGSSRVDASGLNQLCELCGRRLNRIKYHRPDGAGRACMPRCKGVKRSHNEMRAPGSGSSSSSAAAAVPPKRPCRTKSDPGELVEQTESRLRTRPAKPITPSKKQMKEEKEAAARALLEQTHARRLAFLGVAAVAEAATSSSSSTATGDEADASQQQLLSQ